MSAAHRPHVRATAAAPAIAQKRRLPLQVPVAGRDAFMLPSPGERELWFRERESANQLHLRSSGRARANDVSAAPTKTGKFHATFRRAIGLLHPAGSSSAGTAPLSFNDEHFCRREQRPAKRGKRARRPRARHGALDAGCGSSQGTWGGGLN